MFAQVKILKANISECKKDMMNTKRASHLNIFENLMKTSDDENFFLAKIEEIFFCLNYLHKKVHFQNTFFRNGS